MNTQCIPAGGAHYCQPNNWGSGKGGCSAVAGAASPSALLLLVLLGVFALLRRQKLR
jgi:MYXO-CTERM domain-containing protein